MFPLTDYRTKIKTCHPAPFMPKGTLAHGEISSLGARGKCGNLNLLKFCQVLSPIIRSKDSYSEQLTAEVIT